MVKIKIRDRKLIVQDILVFNKNRDRIVRMITSCKGKVLEKELRDQFISITSGFYELVIAEAMAYILGFEYVLSNANEILEPGIYWNGRLEEGIAFMAPQGLSDIEIHLESKSAIIEVSLGLSERSIYRELKETIRHTTLLGEPDYRLLILPSIDLKPLSSIYSAGVILTDTSKLCELLMEERTLKNLEELIETFKKGPGTIDHYNFVPTSLNDDLRICRHGQECIKQMFLNLGVLTDEEALIMYGIMLLLEGLPYIKLDLLFGKMYQSLAFLLLKYARNCKHSH